MSKMGFLKANLPPSCTDVVEAKLEHKLIQRAKARRFTDITATNR